MNRVLYGHFNTHESFLVDISRELSWIFDFYINVLYNTNFVSYFIDISSFILFFFPPDEECLEVFIELLLRGAGGPAEEVLAADDVDDGGEAGGEHDGHVHRELEVVGLEEHRRQVACHLQTPREQVEH